MVRKPPPETVDSFVVPPAESPAENVTIFPDEALWLAVRPNFLNCSELGTLFGYHPRQTPWVLLDRKLGRLPDDGPPGEMAVAGHYDEPTLHRWLWDQRPELLARGVLVENEAIGDLGDYCQVRAKDTPIPLACTPDRFLHDSTLRGVPFAGLTHWWNRRTAGVELKCSFKQQARRWRIAVPPGAILQLQFTMLCMEVDRGIFVVRLDGYEFRYHPMRRRDDWIANWMPRLEQFWECVEKRKALPQSFIDSSAATAQALAAFYGELPEKEVELPYEFEALDDERQRLAADIAQAEKRKGAIENRIRQTLGAAGVTKGVIPGQAAYTWRQTKRGKQLRRSKVSADSLR